MSFQTPHAVLPNCTESPMFEETSILGNLPSMYKNNFSSFPAQCVQKHPFRLYPICFTNIQIHFMNSSFPLARIDCAKLFQMYWHKRCGCFLQNCRLQRFFVTSMESLALEAALWLKLFSLVFGIFRM